MPCYPQSTRKAAVSHGSIMRPATLEFGVMVKILERSSKIPYIGCEHLWMTIIVLCQGAEERHQRLIVVAPNKV